MWIAAPIRAFALAACFAAGAFSAGAETTRLTLLHVNDVYRIDAKDGQGGFARLMTVLEAERARAPGATLTTFGGDLLSPSVLSSLLRGAQMVALMNAVGLDFAVPGNHDFDFGGATLTRRMADSRFTWLASNMTGLAGASSTVVRKVGAVRVGLLGLVTPETGVLSKPGTGIGFLPVVAAARAAVETLREGGRPGDRGATHLGLDEDRALARAVPEIDVILGGHDHFPVSMAEGKALILKAGQDANHVAVVELEISIRAEQGRLQVTVRPAAWRHLSTAGIEPHAGVAAKVRRYLDRMDEQLAAPVGMTATKLDSRRAVVRRGESTMGNLITDAMRDAVQADMALINGGGIRGNRVFEAGSALTRKDVLAELPFGDVTVVLALRGGELRAVLEHGVGRAEHGAGRFLQVSGLAFTWNPSAPAGKRVGEIKVGGTKLAPQKLYRVAVGAYIAGGGDGYAMLRNVLRVIDAKGGEKVATQMMDYIAARKTISPRLKGRIKETPWRTRIHMLRDEQ